MNATQLADQAEEFREIMLAIDEVELKGGKFKTNRFGYKIKNDLQILARALNQQAGKTLFRGGYIDHSTGLSNMR